MPSVMVVEDEKTIRQGIASFIERYGSGLEVRWECSSAQAAWNAFQEGPPDIIITDIIMKGMTGLELIERVRETGCEVPIVVLSGFSEFSYAQTALRYNVVDYLLKPVNIKEFANVLGRICSELQPTSTAQADDVEHAAVRHAVRWIDEHLSQDLAQQRVAEQIGLSSSYLSTLFKKHMGINYTDYVSRSRLEKAEELLRSSSLCIYEVARLCGYQSDKHFSTMFRRTLGVTPSQFRNEGR